MSRRGSSTFEGGSLSRSVSPKKSPLYDDSPHTKYLDLDISAHRKGVPQRAGSFDISSRSSASQASVPVSESLCTLTPPALLIQCLHHFTCSEQFSQSKCRAIRLHSRFPTLVLFVVRSSPYVHTFLAWFSPIRLPSASQVQHSISEHSRSIWLERSLGKTAMHDSGIASNR